MKFTNKSVEKTMGQIIDLALTKDFKWQKFWENIANANAPFNYTTEKPYNGINEFYLNMVMAYRGVSNQFVTYNQCEKAGGKMVDAKGQGIHLIKWVVSYRDIETGKKYSQDEMKKLPNEIMSRLRKTMFETNFVVFPLKNTTLTPKVFDKKRINEPIKIAQKIVDNYSNDVCPIKFGVNNARAFYSLGDYINMPELDAFKTNKAFYHVCFHEMAHSTGHKKRLNRDLSGHFGNDKYAKEELIAELSSNMLSAKLNILNEDLINNSAAYLSSWLRKFSDKKQELYEALSAAKKANEYIIKESKVSI